MTPEQIDALPYRPCVGIALVNSAGLVFAGQRIDSPGNAWQMPQGGIDPGESPRQAALRELEEETGVSANLVEISAEHPEWLPYELPLELVPKLWNGRFRGQTQRWFRMDYSGTDAEISIDRQNPEFSRWQWMDARDLMQRIVPFKSSTYQAVLSGFRLTSK